MKYSISIAMVAILMAAAFVGVSVIGDDADAETTGYSVSYIVDGRTFTVPQETGEGVTPGTVSLATLDALGAAAPKDKTFTAWNTVKTPSEGTPGTAYSAGSTLILDSETKTATLYAQFDWTVYTATFKAVDGTVIKTVTGTAQEGSVKELSTDAPDAPAIDDKIFVGWFTDGAEKALKKAELGKLTSDVTFTATYVVDYKIIFVDGDKTYFSKVSDLTIPDVGERTGYAFLGWYVDDPKVLVDPEKFTYEADTTFTAMWEPVKCYVTFMVGDKVYIEQTVEYGKTATEPVLPNGYSGWDFDFSEAIKGDKTIYAIEKAPEKPTGFDDPTVKMALVIVGLFVCVLLAVIILKREDIRAGMVRKLSKTEEDKKE